jgi:hypothetical protein
MWIADILVLTLENKRISEWSVMQKSNETLHIIDSPSATAYNFATVTEKMFDVCRL